VKSLPFFFKLFTGVQAAVARRGRAVIKRKGGIEIASSNF